MQNTSLLHLSNELLTMIVDHISSSDGYTINLINCSLVCWPLRAPAQRHLFNSVRLPAIRRLEALLEIIRVNPVIATYIRWIVACSHWPFIVDTADGLNMPLAPILLRIKENSPHSPLNLTIRQFSSRFRGEATPVYYVTPNAIHSVLSQLIRLEIDRADIPMVSLSGRGQLKELFLNETRHHDLKSSEGSLQLSAPLLSSVTDLYIGNNGAFPAILMASFPTLLSLVLNTVSFDEDFVVPDALPRPQILSLDISFFEFRTIEILVNSFVDVSLLEQLLDGTVAAFLEDYTIEECAEVTDAIRYILDRSKGTLEHLRINCSASFTFLYSKTVTAS